MFIYKITNLVNGKAYVGLTKNAVEKRLGEHLWNALNKKDGGRCLALESAIIKYGKENFKIETIQTCDSLEALGKAEKEQIERLGTKVPNGYNIKDGGHSGWVHDAESRHRMGLKNIGRTKTESELALLRAASLGTNNAFYGKKHTRESIERANASRKLKRDGMSPEKKAEWYKRAALARIGNKRSAQTVINVRNSCMVGKFKKMPVRYFTSPVGEIWAIKSLNNAAKTTGLTRSNLYKINSGEVMTSHGWSKSSELDLNNCKYINVCWESFSFMYKNLPQDFSLICTDVIGVL